MRGLAVGAVLLALAAGGLAIGGCGANNNPSAPDGSATPPSNNPSRTLHVNIVGSKY